MQADEAQKKKNVIIILKIMLQTLEIYFQL